MLRPSKQIQPPAWMKKPETVLIMEALNRFEEEPAALFVGGCIRDLLFGKENENPDIDIATRLEPQDVTQRLENAGAKVIPTGIEHGTVTAVVNEESFEITTLRRDVSTDGRHAEVEFTQDWMEDAWRRDFTINTVLADTEGRVYDVTGLGLNDISRGVVFFVGDAEQRIEEDFLRILRFFRFHSLFGHGDPNMEALAACEKHADGIQYLSKERVTDEFLKILSVPDPSKIIHYMIECNILMDVLHARFNQDVFSAFCTLQEDNEAVDVMGRLAMISNGDESHFKTLNKSLVLSNKQKTHFVEIMKTYKALNDLSESQLKRLLYKEGKEIFVQAALIHAAKGALEPDHLEFVMHLVTRWDIPSLPISGTDLIELGFKQGPELGDVLRHVETWWVSEVFKPNKEACLDEVKKKMSS